MYISFMDLNSIPEEKYVVRILHTIVLTSTFYSNKQTQAFLSVVLHLPKKVRVQGRGNLGAGGTAPHFFVLNSMFHYFERSCIKRRHKRPFSIVRSPKTLKAVLL